MPWRIKNPDLTNDPTYLAGEISEVNAQLAEKATRGEPITVTQIDKTTGKFDETYMSEAFLQQMAGNTPISAVPPDGGVTPNKLSFELIEDVYLRTTILTVEKLTGSDVQVNFASVGGQPMRLYWCIPNKGYFKITIPINQYTLGHNGYLALNYRTNTISQKDLTVTKLSNDEVMLLLNIEGKIVAGWLQKDIYDSTIPNKLSTVYFRGTVSTSVSGSTLTITPNSTNPSPLYWLVNNGKYTSMPVAAEYILAHNEYLALDIKTKSITRKNITVDTTLLNEIVLALNIDGKLSAGVFKSYLQNNATVGEKVKHIMPDYELLDTTNIPSGYQSMTIVGDELWVGWASNDSHTDYNKLRRYNLDTLELLGEHDHNIGHLNTIDYNPDIDTLIVGNGSGDYNLPLKVWIFPNLTTWKNQPTIDFNSVNKVEIDLSTIPESKVQAVWGEPNGSQNNIIYLITNDNKVVRRCLLGRGSADMGEYGTFINGKNDWEYNGTLKVIKTYQQPDDIDVNQDSDFYNGRLYVSVGHKDIIAYEISFNEDGSTSKRRFQVDLYLPDGTIRNFFSEGMIVRGNKIYHGYIGSTTGIAVYDIPN